MRSIKSRFLILVISGMLVLASVISIVSVLYIRNIINNDADVITESVAKAEMLKLNQKLRDTEYSVQSMKNYVESTIGDAYKIQVDTYRNSYSSTAQETFDAIANGENGLLSYFFVYSADIAKTMDGFFLGRQTTISEFEILPFEGLGDWETTEWINTAKKSGAPVWLAPYEEPTLHKMVISYIVPVFKGHQLIGLVGADLDFSVLTDMVENISVYDNGFAYLTNADDEIAFAPIDSHTLNSARSNHGFAEEHLALDNGMNLIIHADYSDIQSDSYRVISIIILIVVLLTIGFILITYTFTGRIVKPLKELTTAAEHLAEGNTTVHLDNIKMVGEVEVLANAFKRNAEKLHEYTDYIKALAYKDSLTGIKNRTAYNEMVNDLDVKIKIGNIEPFALLVADINGLKVTNDKYGHEAGNRLIKRASKIICDTFKHSPVYRLGGDEFAVILKGEDFENMSTLLEEMDNKCKDSFIIVDSENVPVIIARAAEIFDHAIDLSVEDLFARTDIKMYEDKKQRKIGAAN